MIKNYLKFNSKIALTFAVSSLVIIGNSAFAAKVPSEKSTVIISSVDKVSGKVADASGNGIPGVSVLVKGTTKGTITDANGNFSLELTGNETLIFSFVGFESQ